MDYLIKFSKNYYNKINMKTLDRKLYITRFNKHSNKCYSNYTYYKKRLHSDLNRLKTETDERMKERDYKYYKILF